LNQGTSNSVHRHAISLAVESRQQAGNFVFVSLTKKMQTPGAIFPTAPGEQSTFHVNVE
jgi:hypothetical protein